MAGSLLYAIAAGVTLALLPGLPRSLASAIGDWIAVPMQVIAILVSVRVIWRRRGSGGYAMGIWVLVGAFSAMALLSTYVWNVWRIPTEEPTLSVADGCYFVDYALMTLAYALTFMRFGGSFRSARTWLDAVTILVALLGTFWATLLGPFSPVARGRTIGLLFGGAYAVSIGLLMTMAALLFIRLPRARRRPIPALLIAAGIIDVIWEIAWLANWLPEVDLVGPYYNFGDVLCFACIACAGALVPKRSEPESERASAERNTYTFLPTLWALLAAAIIAVVLASSHATDAWIVVSLVALTALLILTRQAAMREDLAVLTRALAVRAADARLTELVRQSADAFLVVGSQGTISFASPATERVLHVAADRLPGTRAVGLLGAEHEAALSAFLQRVAAEPASPEPMEVMQTSQGALRVLKFWGANQLANPHIEGLALTVTDITALRKLERQVLEVANQERVRLAGDIHEGLGQQLTGITMMLQGAAKAPHRDPLKQQEYLQMIVGHMGEAIRSARDLARGLSPIYVVGGSLHGALQNLGKETGAGPRVSVEVDPSFDDRIIGDFPADHLFRIAQEAVQNASRHSGGMNTWVELRVLEDHLVLTVDDDGCGYEELAASNAGLGLRLMEYRARVIGGAFSIRHPPKAGTHVKVTVPLRYVLADFA